jgi:hypothetical protein
LGYLPAYLLILASLIIGTRLYVLFGWLSDRVGRLKIILTGCLIAALTYFQLFAALTHYANPDLEAFSDRNAVTVAADGSTCELHVFVTGFTKFSNCDRAQDLVTKLGVSFRTVNVPSRLGCRRYRARSTPTTVECPIPRMGCCALPGMSDHCYSARPF